jgi:hypothetical protein
MRASVWLPFAVLPLVAIQACERLSGIPGQTEVLQPAASVAECVVDDDCGLMPPRMTCCGECDPVPPFEAVPRTAIDAVLIDLETACAQSSSLCEPPECAVLTPGCVARAICLHGTCRVIESGCAPLVASYLDRDASLVDER